MKVYRLFCVLFLVAYAMPASAVEKKLTDAEQVAGIQKMCADSSEAIKQRQAQKSLYDRLGKRKGIKALITKLVTAHRANKRIGHMFAHSDLKKVIKNSTDFLVVGTGGKATYHGKDMGTVHRRFKITNGDFLSAGNDVQTVMKKMKYGENEIQEVVCALTSFVPVVVVPDSK